MYTRRQFLETSLKKGSVVSIASSIPCFLTQSLQAAENNSDGNILVVIELSGGNDGLNTVIPFADENYEKYRPTLRVPRSQILKLDDETGLHPALEGAAELVEDGKLAIVQGVGYPNPNRSHFESSAIWQSAQLDPEAQGSYGWLGRALDQQAGRAHTFAESISLGEFDPPLALRGRHSTTSAIRTIQDLQLESIVGGFERADAEEPADDLLQFVRRRTVEARDTAARLANRRPSVIRAADWVIVSNRSLD